MLDFTNPEDITYLYQTEEFCRLSALEPNVRCCYDLWRKKDVTLEHAISLSVKLLAERCYIVQRPLPASSLVFLGKHIDFTKDIYEARSIPDLVKIRLLSDYLRELSKMALAGKRLRSFCFEN